MYQKRRQRCTISPISSTKTFFFPKTKKAQVTIFIIVGIVMLLAVALVLLLQKQIVSFKVDELIPTEKGKVETYLTSCIQQAGDEALFLIGTQGGYIDVPKDIQTDASQHLRLSPMNVLPYWAYGQNVRIPPLSAIKQELDTYIEQHTKSCLLDLQPFQDTYNIVEKSPIKADTNIADGKVLFNVNWNVELQTKSGEKVAEVIEHTAESPAKLKRLHETASRIIDSEMSSLKIEDLTQDLIALEHPNVPVTGIELSCKKKTWNPKTVESELKKLIHINLKELRIQGTNYIAFPEELSYYQNHYIWNIGEEFNQPKISTTFNYDEKYPFIFAVTPIAGGKMQSSQFGGSDVLSLLCIQQWKFTYDVSYPVQVRLTDDTNYNFQMAFTVHLIRNIPNRGAEITARQPIYIDTTNDEAFCTHRTIPMSIKTYELVENDLGVYTRDPLEDVDITYTCLRYKCDIGKTQYDSSKNQVGFTTNYPYCPGGILRATKPNYKESWIQVPTIAGKEHELNLIPQLNIPLKNINIIKHELLDKNQIGSAEPLGKKETALIKISYTKPIENITATSPPSITSSLPQSPSSSPVQSSSASASGPLHKLDLIKTGTPDELLEQEQPLTLLAKADFTYDLEIQLFSDEQFVGGYKGKWLASHDQLASSTSPQITFHVGTKPKATEEELYTLLLSLEQQTQNIPKPEIK